MKRMTSKDRRHAARKRIAIKRGPYATVRPGYGINPTAYMDLNAGLIRVTENGIYLYR